MAEAEVNQARIVPDNEPNSKTKAAKLRSLEAKLATINSNLLVAKAAVDVRKGQMLAVSQPTKEFLL